MFEEMISIKRIYAEIEKKDQEARSLISEKSNGVQEMAALYEPERIKLIKEAQCALKEHGFLWDTEKLNVIIVHFKATKDLNVFFNFLKKNELIYDIEAASFKIFTTSDKMDQIRAHIAEFHQGEVDEDLVRLKPISWRDHVFFVERHIGRCLTNVA
ncbi:hypothetical protein [Serratia sp. Se-RSBMAAmG]|uniref:hypothetical protein n=1 Tax=Serratia sp. Se-RSBMAAmG TaxID=3043305 RepID=UPI0024AE9720|nr:hypothetical protein [Serratia sp. Se-RSBMAAmG]MDI6975944.1 hypothetical protein [Serratia sp. Se-RSBMAAmG]